MNRRRRILAGMGAGAVWALTLVWGGQNVAIGFVPLNMVVPLAMVVPGLVLMVVIGRLAQRRFFDDTLIDGQDFAPGSPAWVDQRMLTNTAEQTLLALLLWPFVAFTLGGAVVVVMGLGFGVARIAFWTGYHRNPPLRAFGFAATFYPTVLAVLWALAVWLF